jgi:hypothetical protein
MLMLKSFSQLAKKIIRSRLGWTFLALHLFLAFLVFGEKRSTTDQATYAEFQQSGQDYVLIAGRGVHIGVESELMKLLFIIDLPALLIGFFLIVGLSLFYSNMPVIITSWIDAGILLFLTSVQWLLIGHLIQQHNILEGIHSDFRFQR